ncbi:peptidase M23 [Tardiphaga robiniae]|uniref:Peptidase M23 n=2 Tax=Tardiphaga robiniae TaxID=943830 RepID=A0A161QZI1_9BRAD|nr:peptidase M23 [Tardiphaga robiniae]
MRKALWTALVATSVLTIGTNAPIDEWEALASSFICSARAADTSQMKDTEWTKVDEILGRKPTVTDDVRRYGFPRSDLSVTLDGIAIKSALALGGWVAFKPAHGSTMIMGDLVLLESEINPVMTKMIANGIDITAVHNHLLRATPATFYMHVAGHGDPMKLATAVRDALAESKTPLTVAAQTSPAPAVDLDTAKLDEIIGSKGQSTGGVYQFNVPRKDPVNEGGVALTPPGPMGVAIGINFQPTGGGKAAITGDFVLTGEEVNPVVRALKAHGIDVTALHSHMLDENPRLYFMHFWANADTIALAKGLRAALDRTASGKM